MKLQFKLQAQAAPIFRRMADEAGLSVNDLGEIAVYALIASYGKDHPELGLQEQPARVDVNPTGV